MLTGPPPKFHETRDILFLPGASILARYLGDVPEQWIGAASANSLQALIATATTDRGLCRVFGETIR
jgi:hypothetical protein